MLDIGLFFPTVIASDCNESLSSYMLPIAKKYLIDNTSTNNLVYNSTYNADSGIEKDPEITPFLDYINSLAAEYLDKNGYDMSRISLRAKVFVSEMKYGDFHNYHIHPNCILSGIMYLQAPEGSAPIIFSDSRSEKRMLSLPRQQENDLNKTEVSIFPRHGMTLIWESWIPHSVPKNYSTDSRITAVFNFSLN